MYTLVLAVALSSGGATPAGDIYADIRDIKKEVQELKKNQTQLRDDGLKLVIATLRQKITDEKLDELRRDIRTLKYEEDVIARTRFAARVMPLALPMPRAASLASTGQQRTVISMQLPAGATFAVNDTQIPLSTSNPTFITPPLQPGRDYFYDIKVTTVEDGKSVTRTKRVTVRAGGVVRLNYADMMAP